ncbi:MAG: N-acetyltransferase [Bauldia sp.]|nr:N-acetyltransferase [Bauldia sp.]
MLKDSTAAVRPATIRTVAGVAEVGRAAWDALANPGWPSDAPLAGGSPGALPYNPFLSFDFLDCLDQSGSTGRKTGWTPSHVLLDEGAGGLAGIMPAYLKTHSMGEYVFDHGWAEAFQRNGARYYPKLQAAVPFTPATGRRLLVRPGDTGAARALAEGATAVAANGHLSSVHVTFMPEDEWNLCASVGYLKRTDAQFRFENPGYRDFEDFLSTFASRKRKAVHRERREALANGISVEFLTGPSITEEAWDAFFAFYMDTGGRKWGSPYLNRRFFALVGERMADRILLIMAKRDGRYIAGALNFIGSETLFGRYWGAIEHHPFLHFEVCYYQAIDWGIAHGLKRVEAGAQGEHKLARGYMPTPTYSAHWIADPRYRDAIAAYLVREREQSAADVEMLSEHAPFRHEQD